MRLYSTRNPALEADLKRAVMGSLPPDNGLYTMRIQPLPDTFFSHFEEQSFAENSFQIARHLLEGAVPDDLLRQLTVEAINFPAPLVPLRNDLGILELFHGPSLAFKDFGARFMSRLMHHFQREETEELLILVATSGDTGGAVAFGFHQVPGIRVVVLYPSGKVSQLQEKQLTTLGGNVTALEIAGTFDDCQRLVKAAFLDPTLRNLRLSSANSINIARLIPQTFYYFESFRQIPLAVRERREITYVVPSGNLGNLTAGLMARQMGLPIRRFVAATNANRVVPHYLESRSFLPQAAIATLSNAMDVGNPSNFPRLTALFGPDHADCSTWNIIRDTLTGIAVTDEQTKEAMEEAWRQFGYVLDPHAAVGYCAWNQLARLHPTCYGVLLETAHPAKFLETVRQVVGDTLEIPERLQVMAQGTKVSLPMGSDYGAFREFLMCFGESK